MSLARIALLLCAGLLVAPFAAMAQRQPLQLRLERGITEPLPIAILPFAGGPGAAITGVVVADLASTGLFRPVRTETLTAVASGLDAPPNLALLRASSDATALVAGDSGYEPDGRLVVRFRLWDARTGEQMAGFQYRADPASQRRIAHRVADAIYERIVGEPGYFETRIAFIAESGPKSARRKRVAVMDYDGENIDYLTDGSELVLTPRFSPNEESLTYISYQRGQPRIHLMNLDTRRREMLGRFPGMTFAPRFSPDGRRVVMSRSNEGGTDIYELDLATRGMRRLTTGASIDTSPSYSPDGSRIVFESDRGGGQQLYTMNRDGSGLRRISFGEGRYATPVWSPRGDLIAFTRINDNQFSIGVMGTDGSGERILTSSFLDEGPTWSPNGRRLMFYRETPGAGGMPRVYEIDVAGGRPRPVRTPEGASDPSWGPARR